MPDPRPLSEEVEEAITRLCEAAVESAVAAFSERVRLANPDAERRYTPLPEEVVCAEAEAAFRAAILADRDRAVREALGQAEIHLLNRAAWHNRGSPIAEARREEAMHCATAVRALLPKETPLSTKHRWQILVRFQDGTTTILGVVEAEHELAALMAWEHEHPSARTGGGDLAAIRIDWRGLQYRPTTEEAPDAAV